MLYQKNLTSYLLDECTLKDIRLWQQRHDAIMAYYWEHYSHFTHQRSLIMDDLKQSLIENCKPLEFENWQRVVDYQYSLHPLSAKGSILNPFGGRFNIGDIDPTKYTIFAGLYLAENREIAYKEKYDLFKSAPTDGLSAEELQLTSVSSTTIVNVNGKINSVLRIDKLTLKKFFNLIKKIKLSRHLIKEANRLNIPVLFHVKTENNLIRSLLYPNWKEYPMILNIPSNSQVLGHLCFTAGIEAVLYPSKMNAKKNCLVVFPSNFNNSNSYVEIQGGIPHELIHRRLDSTNFNLLC